jgi:hypothetical protein
MLECFRYRCGGMYQIQWDIEYKGYPDPAECPGCSGTLSPLGMLKCIRDIQILQNVLGAGGTLEQSLGRKLKCRVWTSEFVIEKKKGVHHVK